MCQPNLFASASPTGSPKIDEIENEIITRLIA